MRTPKARVLADLQQKSKLGGMRPSDEVEGLKFEVRWEPAKGAFGIMLPQEESVLPKGYLFVVCLRLMYSICFDVILTHQLSGC